MKSNLAFEVLNEDDGFDDNSQVNALTISSTDVSDNNPPSSRVRKVNASISTGLASLEIDDLPLSVSPLMGRKFDVKRILNAVNDSLTHE